VSKTGIPDTPYSTEEHWNLFADFTRLKFRVGEPSPHLQVVAHMNRGSPILEQVWRACVYAATYNIPAAEMIWDEWALEVVLKAGQENLELWLTKHWKGIPTRTERRCVRTPKKMAECLYSAALWSMQDFPRFLSDEAAGEFDSNEKAYDALWESASKIRYMGRYIIIRLVELFHRQCGVQAHLFDIRTIGGTSPKRALCLLFPDESEVLLGKETTEHAKLIDHLARKAIMKFRMPPYRVENMSHYVFAAMLCEYRVAVEDGRQYPGRTQDQELNYARKVKDFWGGTPLRMWEARKQLFPPVCLGEIGGWDGVRPNLNAVLRDFGYNWCDVLYDYSATTDMKAPVKR